MTRRGWLTCIGGPALAAGLAGCQAVPPAPPALDYRGGWSEGTARYCTQGQGQRAYLNAQAGWLEHYAREDHVLLGGMESTVGFWAETDIEYTWDIGELRGYLSDHELLTSHEHHQSLGPITCVAPRYP